MTQHQWLSDEVPTITAEHIEALMTARTVGEPSLMVYVYEHEEGPRWELIVEPGILRSDISYTHGQYVAGWSRYVIERRLNQIKGESTAAARVAGRLDHELRVKTADLVDVSAIAEPRV